jgi:hypothetical protein
MVHAELRPPNEAGELESSLAALARRALPTTRSRRRDREHGAQGQTLADAVEYVLHRRVLRKQPEAVLGCRPLRSHAR